MSDFPHLSGWQTHTDFPPNPLEKPGYRLAFHDDFSGSELDETHWFPYYLPHWGTRERTAARYSLAQPGLRLHIHEHQLPWNPAFDGDLKVSALETGSFSGPVGSGLGQLHFRPDLQVVEAQPTQRLYTPTYGFFETRLKAIPLPGYMVALWLMGFEERPEQSGEICICELFGSEVQEASAQVGYGIHPFGDTNLRDEFYQDVLPINAAHYHVYAAEWTPEQVLFFVDNVLIRTVEQSAHYPMQFMLAVYEFPQQVAPEARSGPWPKTFEVDYVRGYEALKDT